MMNYQDIFPSFIDEINFLSQTHYFNVESILFGVFQGKVILYLT